ncbi:uncharacterized protein LOC111342696 [Stylophora pistillata]|uniref:uncharacterized protein LOC111342696 n=1 Tax=Stylophora pistillata TaxID=50429 RepID=UPI000C0566B1|nr:uncharacterized protein LOC111342696 [Stylophora pistillata]
MAKIDVNRQDFNFVIDDDVVYNHILEGQVFQRLTVSRPPQCHVKCKDNCLCVSLNYFPQSKESNCELNDANKYTEPAAMKWRDGGNYYDLVRSYTVKCINRCCSPNPCLNGGVCQEICVTHSVRFSCGCPNKYTGQRCEKIKPNSCKDIAKYGASTSGKYEIFDSNNEPFSVYCDLKSEPGFVWTMIESFSLAERKTFMDKGFNKNFEFVIEKGKGNWNRYRLSLLQMQSLADHSTHLRATCNFPTDGLHYVDYARAKLTDHDIFGNWNRCQMYEYVNIRGNNCSNCTALTKQNVNVHWHIKSYKSKEEGCAFDGKPGAIKGEKNFGQYLDIQRNPNHRCSSSDTSTTQHWFGAKYDV